MEQSVRIGSTSGLHARPAAAFVREAKGFQSQVLLSKNEKTVNAKSLLSLLTLGAAQGDDVLLIVNGDDADAAMSRLASILEENLG